MFDDINNDISLSISHSIKVSYYLDWMQLFELGKQTEQEMEFAYRFKKDITKKIENAVLQKDNFDLSFQAYNEFYQNELKRFNDMPSNSLPQSNYKLTALIKYLICLELAYRSLKDNQFYIALHFYNAYQYHYAHLKLFEGYSNDEIKEKGWRKSERGNNPKQLENKNKGLEIAREILKVDLNKTLTSSDIAEMIKDIMECIKTDEQEKLPEIKQIRENWLKELIPTNERKRGRPNSQTTQIKRKLKEKLVKELINKYQYTVG